MSLTEEAKTIWNQDVVIARLKWLKDLQEQARTEKNWQRADAFRDAIEIMDLYGGAGISRMAELMGDEYFSDLFPKLKGKGPKFDTYGNPKERL